MLRVDYCSMLFSDMCHYHGVFDRFDIAALSVQPHVKCEYVLLADVA
jgi:hypothetical protein